MSQSIETMLSEQQVFNTCKYLRQAVTARQEDTDYDISHFLCEIEMATGFAIDSAARHSIEGDLPNLVNVKWREIDDFELAAVLRNAGVLTFDDTEWVSPFRGDTFEESLKFMREEEARRKKNVTRTTPTQC